MISIQDLATFCKKKGFIYRNAEIYGGMAGFFDYGHLGVELNNNIKQALWKRFVTGRDDVVGIDGSLMSPEMVFKASGHLESFADAMLECSKCHEKVKASEVLEAELHVSVDGKPLDEVFGMVKDNKLKCPSCGHDFKEPELFNLMFKLDVGAKEGSIAYLRPETAQSIFTNFKLVFDNARLKLPCGIAQVGKAFRNEIAPREFLFRCREFEQFELEYFVHPEKLNGCPGFGSIADMEVNFYDNKNESVTTIGDLVQKKIFKSKWHAYWVSQFYKFFLEHGIRKEHLRIRQHQEEELAHYAAACFDIEYKFHFGWREIHGDADRKQFDLTQHSKFSKTDLSVFDEETQKKVMPYVAAEPSQGIGRAMLAFLCDAYHDDKERGNIVLKLHPKLAPIKVGVFPLLNKLDEKAREIFDMLKEDFHCTYDKSGSVGRRYARADETGIPVCCTIDFETLDDSCVTLRDRDSTKQVRVKISGLKEAIQRFMAGEKLEKLGTPVTKSKEE